MLPVHSMNPNVSLSKRLCSKVKWNWMKFDCTKAQICYLNFCFNKENPIITLIALVCKSKTHELYWTVATHGYPFALHWLIFKAYQRLMGRILRILSKVLRPLFQLGSIRKGVLGCKGFFFYYKRPLIKIGRLKRNTLMYPNPQYLCGLRKAQTCNPMAGCFPCFFQYEPSGCMLIFIAQPSHKQLLKAEGWQGLHNFPIGMCLQLLFSKKENFSKSRVVLSI